MSTKEATKPIKDMTIAEQVAYLDEVKRMGNAEKILAVGRYFLAKMGLPEPSEPQTFTYSPRYDANGNDATPKRPHVPYQPDGILQKVNTKPADSQFSRQMDTANHIEGEYLLTIHGVSLNMARGTETIVSYDQATNKQVVNVIPETQNFKGRIRTINPRQDMEQYMFFWMHPRNFDSPARLSPDKQEAYGLKVAMISKYYMPTQPARIRSNVTYKAEHKQTMDNADNLRISAELARKTERDLRTLAKLTNIPATKMAAGDPSNMRAVYEGYLYEVINGKHGHEFRTRLMTAMHRGDDETLKTVKEAFKKGILVVEDGEFFISDGGNLSQPLTLIKYILDPAAAGQESEWLAMEIEYRKDSPLTHFLDDKMVEVDKASVTSGRDVTKDAIEAVDRAIATGTVIATKKPNNWILAKTGETICSWSGTPGHPSQQRKSLLEFASSMTLPTLLLNLGLVEEEVE